ncbi:MAG: response regulator [Desulfobacterales bacterium]|nr:response regulator [Desulfobacterales bacterium]
MKDFSILLVDDEERFARNLAKILEQRGYAVATAFNGSQALALLGSGIRIGVVLLDVRMPGMDGIETLRRIKQIDGDIQVIMLTGFATLEDGIEAVRTGAFDYLQKPYDIEDLIVKIRSARDLGRIKRHPLLWPRTLAGEIILSGFIPLLPDDPLPKAVAIFERYRNGEGAQMLFVVDDRHQVQGLLTKRDILDHLAQTQPAAEVTWEWVRDHRDDLPGLPLKHLMRHPVETVAFETPLNQTAELMLSHRYDSIPVISDGAVLGIIRLRDVLHYLPDEKDDLDGRD